MEELSLKQESERLEALYTYGILDTAPEAEYDQLVELASDIAGVPVSLVTLVDRDRQWFKARRNFKQAETSRDISFCSHAIATEGNLVVEDALADQRFAGNPLVTGDPQIRFYAGFPLQTSKGHKLGTLCVIDQRPRRLSTRQMEQLGIISRQIVQLLELRIRNRQLVATQERIQEKQLLLERLVRHQRKTMAILGHDTRGPLMSMHNLLEMIASNPASVDLPTVFGMMKQQVRVTLDLMENLTNWGSAQLGEAEEEQPYMLAELAGTVLAYFRQAAAGKGLKLVNEVPASVQLSYRPDMIAFIIRNLVHNAVKYTRAGKIWVIGKTEGGRLYLEVGDTGVGMPALVQQRLFSGKSTSRPGTENEHGSGLGLMLIHEFVQESGGSIQVQSVEGAGTRFLVQIPLPVKEKSR